LIVGAQVREGGEEPLISSPGRVLALRPHPERHRLEEAVIDEGCEDGVEVSGGFSLAVSLEQAQHLVPIHGSPLRRRRGRSSPRAQTLSGLEHQGRRATDF